MADRLQRFRLPPIGEDRRQFASDQPSRSVGASAEDQFREGYELIERNRGEAPPEGAERVYDGDNVPLDERYYARGVY